MPSFDDLRLETPPLILRPPRVEDLDTWSEMMLDEPSARFIGGVMPRPIRWRQLRTMIGAWHSHGFAMFSVIEKESGWVGRLGPCSRKDGRAPRPRAHPRTCATDATGARAPRPRRLNVETTEALEGAEKRPTRSHGARR